MRKSRTLQCFENSGLVHKFWKCHNSEFLLKSDYVKALYNRCSKKALKHKSVSNNIEIQAFCYMDNHVHLLCAYQNGVENLSKFMQLSHSNFGMAYNKKYNRQGKVANERPKTPVVEDGGQAQVFIHMYIEANPLRAGIVKNLNELKNFKYSSFQFYAYGIKNEYTMQLSEPAWYTKLGKTSDERQKKYLKIFTDYLNHYGWTKKMSTEQFKTNKTSVLRDHGSKKFIKYRRFILNKVKIKRKQHQELNPREIIELILKKDSS